MSFLDDIFNRLQSAGDAAILQELRDGQTVAVSGYELLRRVGQARGFLASKALKHGERCALLANNGIDWVAVSLAIMAEGLIMVPLYARQAPAELVAMMKDCSPALICCGDVGLRDGILSQWFEAPPQALFPEIFTTMAAVTRAGASSPHHLADSDAMTVIYSS
jgi:acyl-CoA synthetase (AMP-forming)/AMP-acid ligase II